MFYSYGIRKNILSTHLVRLTFLFIGAIVFSINAYSQGVDALSRYEKSSSMQISEDGRFIWSVLPDVNQVVVVSVKTNSIVAKMELRGEPRALALTSDGAWIAASADNAVYKVDVINNSEKGFQIKLRDGVGENGAIVTGAEPRSLVVDKSNRYVYVANSSQDTIVAISMDSMKVIHSLNIKESVCNVGDKDRHFYPQGLAFDKQSDFLYVTRFLSYTSQGGVQRDDKGKEGVVCAVKVQPEKKNLLKAVKAMKMKSQYAGFYDSNGVQTSAFPNQLNSITLRDGVAYLPNIAASPTGPQDYQTITQAFVNRLDIDGISYNDRGAINIHLGGRDPLEGHEELYFANPVDIAFDTMAGEGRAFVLSAGSDIVVELKVGLQGELNFTSDSDSTKYYDLNDPDNDVTSGRNAGKHPSAVVFHPGTKKLYTLNLISRNISVIDPNKKRVVEVISIGSLPKPGSFDERLLVGAEMFFSSRGYFYSDAMIIGSDRNRLSEKGRQNCASCHAGGFTDGVVWQFATGPRKTISVNGTFSPVDPHDQRIINASAIFDEVEDADFNTRLVSSKGWLSEPAPCIDQEPFNDVGESIVDPDHGLILGEWNIFAFAACSMNQFARPNAGRPQPFVKLPGSDTLVRAHDALIDWQRFGIRTPNAPLAKNDLRKYGVPVAGGLDDKLVEEGRFLFERHGCQKCHSGAKWTTSKKDFVSPPDVSEVATESGVENTNPFEFLHRFLKDIGSYGLGVPKGDNSIPGYRDIGGVEIDGAGRLALGKDHNGDGLGNGYNTYSILGVWSSPPYYHNGACETLRCVLGDSRHRNAGIEPNQTVMLLENDYERAALVEFLRSIDESTPVL